MKILHLNIISEDELDRAISKLLNELHSIYRLRKTAPGAADYDRKEQYVFTELKLLAELFPHSRKTRVRVKISYDRWSRTENKSARGVQVLYEDGGTNHRTDSRRTTAEA